MKFIVVENNIIENIVFGTLDQADPSWIPATYRVDIGWKWVEEYKSFVPPTWTDSDWETYKNTHIAHLNDLKNYYNQLVVANHYMQNYDEEKQEEIREFTNSINELSEKIELDISNVNLVDQFYKEPIQVRPNVDSEV
jgi:hypothetical protein